MGHSKIILTATAVLGVAAECGAQQVGIAGWDIRVSNVVSPNRPSAVIEVWAWMDDLGGSNMAFGAGIFDLVAADGRFSDPAWLRTHFLGRLGTVTGNRVLGVYAHNLPFPFIPDPTNPYSLWKVTWTAKDFTPRRVTLDTANTRMQVGYEPNWLFVDLPAFRFFPSHVEIEVSPDCYPDCDSSTGGGILDIFDFLCFQDRFLAAEPYACDCDTNTGAGVCDIFDFLCFQGAFSEGCR
jgi:hypothetical protein